MDESDAKLISLVTRMRMILGEFVIELNANKIDVLNLIDAELDLICSKLNKDKEIPEGYEGHIHGCGHPVRPLILCDDVFCLIQSRYFDWWEEHQNKKEGECICFFCWESLNKMKEGKCPFDDQAGMECVHRDSDGYCHGVCARSQQSEIEINPDDNMLCKDNGGCSGGVMHKQSDGTYICDVCLKRIY